MIERSRILIQKWYQHHKRDLPWRHTKDAYRIWLSEIILQQTRVQQGLPYYLKFIKAFPNIKDLALAHEAEVLYLWQGLGYYSRARNMHFTAKLIMENFNGIFPSDYNDIRSLKGVGEYTAAAIASFSYDLPYAAVDGNMLRVISRIYGIVEDISLPRTKKIIINIASEMMDESNPALFNQSMMEFGAIQCKAAAPNCNICPLQATCFAYVNNKVKELPLKINRIKVRNRYFDYLVIRVNKNNLFIRQRREKDIWQNLYEFPLIESQRSLKRFELINEIRNMHLCKSQVNLLFRSSEIKHKLSHQLLHIHFNIIECELDIIGDDWIEIPVFGLADFAFPEIINKNKELLIKHL